MKLASLVVPMLVLLFVALWFILRGDLLYVFPFVFSVLLVLRLPRLGKRELILVLFVRLFGLCLFRFVGFLLLLLRFAIVAPPGLFSSLFYKDITCFNTPHTWAAIRSAWVANVLLCIPVPNDERQQEQGFRAKHSE